MRPDRFVDVEEIDDKRAMPAHNEAVAAVGHQRQWTTNIIVVPTYLLRSPHQIRHLLRIGRLAQIEDSEAFLSDDNRPRANDGDSAMPWRMAVLTRQDARVVDILTSFCTLLGSEMFSTHTPRLPTTSAVLLSITVVRPDPDLVRTSVSIMAWTCFVLTGSP